MADAQTTLRAMEWRCIGPFRGGRVVAVAGDPVDPFSFYFGACAGGVWKTTNGGIYWENVSDGFFNTAAVGAIAVSDSDPNVLYAGMGESCIRGDVSHGDGVYRSTDRGKTWRHLGLADTRHIARIRIHPTNPDLVYVAALGHAFGPNLERGVFRSKDGGATWEHVLFRSANAGAIDLSMDPSNPRVLYAAIWEARRTPWSLTSGGPDSSIYKSTDGGDTWIDISSNPGLPAGIKGRIGIAVSPARPDRVWAIVEAADSALFRSDDAGATWQRVSEDREIQSRRWYYNHIFADPRDADTLWALATRCFNSTDGGVTFVELPTPHGDNHDLWIDPRNPLRMIEGNDGGACVSFNGGATWSTIYNQPTGQFYHLTTDNQFPYRIYGTQQDNSAISVPSRSSKIGIPISDCYVTGSSESGHIAVRPDNPNIVFSGAIGSAPGGGGALLCYDHSSGQTRIVTAWPEFYGGRGPKDLKYRFQWTFPIAISPHDPNVLYTAGNQVFRSTDNGTSWEVISPDLTRNDPSKQEASGGPITLDTTGAEHYCTIFAFAESPHERGTLWAGSDDGLIHCSRDGGHSWDNVTPPELPEWATVSIIEPSPHDPATVYVAAYRYKLDDLRPYLFKTSDYGKTWQAISTGIPDHEFTRVVRADPERRGLLVAGTETGLHVSMDDGGSWEPFRLNLPVAPVYDLAFKDGGLIAATHGRSFWILDDLTPLRGLTEQVQQEAAHLFQPRPSHRFRSMTAGIRSVPGINYSSGLGGVSHYEIKRPDGQTVRVMLDAGTNPADGVVVAYYLREQPAGEVALSFLDAQGRLVRRFSSKEEPDEQLSAEEAAAPLEEEDTEELTVPAQTEDQRVAKKAGLNRFTWNMRYPDAHKVAGDFATERALAGPLVPPGTYRVQLTVNGQTSSESFEILKDPRVRATGEDLDAQFDLLVQIQDKLTAAHDAVNQIRAIRRQIDEWLSRATGRRQRRAVDDAAGPLKERLAAAEEGLIQTKMRGESDRLNYPGKLNAKLVNLAAVVASADSVPTRQSYEVFGELGAGVDAQVAELARIIQTDIPAFGNLLRDSGIPPIVPTPTS